MDRRQRKSRQAIFGAFSSLLSTRRYSDITVQDIIDLADVGRSTFYAHFGTKDALLREVCTELFNHVVKDHDEAEATHDFSERGIDTDSVIIHILYHLRDNENNIIGILKGESGELLLRFFRQNLTDVFQAELSCRKKPDGVPEDYVYYIISCAFVDTLDWWIQNGMKLSPEEVEKCFRAVMADVI